MKKSVILIMAALAVIMAFGGCSIFNRKMEYVTINVEPGDASVFVNGVEFNNPSPHFVKMDDSRQLFIRISKPGYREVTHFVDSQLTSTGKIDAWSSFWLFPALGLFSNGAWELKEHNFTFDLQPLAKECKTECPAVCCRTNVKADWKTVSPAEAKKDEAKK